MAKPRVFVSSTYYDLKHLRSAFETFLDGLGYEPILSEKGSIAYAPDAPLDESCYKEAEQADIFVLIVGGRYGSEVSKERSEENKDFFTRYDSVTREEFRSAVKSNVPIYVLIERAVHSEYQTFLKNRESEEILYAHVDSVNIFRMIDEIVSLPKNNPIFTFDRYHEIEDWLREQWASLFRELLDRSSNNEKLNSLSSQVSQLGETNKTLRKYLESLMTHVAPDSRDLIDSEGQRLREIKEFRKIKGNGFVEFLSNYDFSTSDSGILISSSRTVKDLFDAILDQNDDAELRGILKHLITNQESYLMNDLNRARNALDLSNLTWGISKKRAEDLYNRDD